MNKSTRIAAAAALLCAAAGPALAATPATTEAKSTVADRRSVSITIYNDNLGLVKDVRSIELGTGTRNLWFEGVAAQIDPTSVSIRSLDAPRSLRVLEQNFEYDLISPDKLMEKYLGENVELVTEHDGKSETTRARLIGNQGGTVYELEDGRIAVNPPGRLVLPRLPEGLISKPSLVWLLDSKRPRQSVEASYLTSGIGWKADYVSVLSADEKNVDITGWVTIDNKSGATYEDASLKLVAGNVNRVRPEYPRAVPLSAAVVKRSDEGFHEESFFEYHLYTLQRKATVRDNQTKQISLLSVDGAKVKKTYVVNPGYRFWFRQYDAVDKPRVGVYLVLDNSRKNGMGMPLPKGTVRVYKKDSGGSLQFVGEDRIDHTPEDETVRIKMGDAFDIVAERSQTNFEVLSSGHLYRSSYKVALRNHKKEAVTVSVVEQISGDWTITQSSVKFEKETATRVRFDVPVAAGGTTDLTYTVETRM